MSVAPENILATSRVLPFSAEDIFRAIATGDLLEKWWGPQGFTNTFQTFEFYEGGQWIFQMHGPDGQTYKNESIFESIVPNKKVIVRHDCAPYFTLTIKLSATEGGTLVNWNQAFDDTKVAQAIKERAGSGNEENIDRLTGLLNDLVIKPK